MSDIGNLVSEIPNVLMYFVPGFFTICTYSFFTSNNFEKKSYFLAWCVTISYIIQIFIGSALSEPVVRMILSLIIAIVVGYIIAQLMTHEKLNWFVTRISKKSINSDIIKDVFDYELGCVLSICDNNSHQRYVGTLFETEEKGKDSWLALTKYEIWNKNGATGKWEEDDFDDGYRSNRSLILKLSDIKYIEVIYAPNSKTIPEKYFK